MRGNNDTIGFKVRGEVVAVMAQHDRLAQHLEMATGFVEKVAADGLVVVQNQIVGDLALGAAEGFFQPAMEGGWRKRRGGVSTGANGGDDHQVR